MLSFGGDDILLPRFSVLLYLRPNAFHPLLNLFNVHQTRNDELKTKF